MNMYIMMEIYSAPKMINNDHFVYSTPAICYTISVISYCCRKVFHWLAHQSSGKAFLLLLFCASSTSIGLSFL